MPMYVIIKSYSSFEGTFQSNEGFTEDPELAQLAVEHFEKINQDRIDAYEHFNNTTLREFDQKNPQPIYPKNDKNMEKFSQAFFEWNKKRMKILELRPQEDFDTEYSWFYEELPEIKLEDLIK